MTTYYAAKACMASARALRDGVLDPLIMSLWVADYKVYRVRKMWKAMHRAGQNDRRRSTRDQVGRLICEIGSQGVRKGKSAHHPAPTARPTGNNPDLVDPKFVAERRNALWVTELTHVQTWSGVVYVCFIVYSRAAVGEEVGLLASVRRERFDADSTPQSGLRRSRQSGSHLVVRFGRCQTVVAVHSGDVKLQTLRSIVKALRDCIGEEWSR